MKQTRIKIGPVVYTEKFIKNLTGSENQPLFGQVRHLPREIELDASLTGVELLLTRWHEALHALEDIYGIVLSEGDISVLAAGIVQVQMDNPCMRFKRDKAK
jgi:hypothetical protein